MPEDVMLREAIEAISLGQRTRARDLLTRLLRTDQNNADYWIWMSSAVDTTSERIYCLESALRLDPFNSTAIRGLVLLGARPAEEGIKPAPFVRRKWGSAFEAPEPPKSLLVRIYENPALRFLAIGAVIVLLAGLIWLGTVGLRTLIQHEPLIIAKIPITPEDSSKYTPTPTVPTKTPVVRSPTPTFIGPTPLKLMLSATYTPAPLYVNTPHPISEAYSAGLRAYYREDYSTMLNYMLQAVQNDPEAPDTNYYVGEAYRLLGENDQALEAYNQSIAFGKQFAPAYLGRARVLMLTKSDAEVAVDLQQAIDLDPKLVDAYIVRAGYLLGKGKPEDALKDLTIAESQNPDLPLLYVYRAQALLELGKKEDALEDARRAHDMDFTSLPAYLALGQASLANGLSGEALDALNTYVVYIKDNPDAWLALGQAYTAGRENSKAIEAYNHALDLNKNLADAYYYRGLAFMGLEEGQKAVNDLAIALRLNPYSFDISLELGHALLVASRPNDAYGQINSSKALANGDAQLARVYYWRAIAQEALGNRNSAIQDWQVLLDLPEKSVPADLLETAQEHLRILTATATPTNTPTPSPTLTRHPTLTPSLTRTPSLIPTQKAP